MDVSGKRRWLDYAQLEEVLVRVQKEIELGIFACIRVAVVGDKKVGGLHFALVNQVLVKMLDTDGWVLAVCKLAFVKSARTVVVHVAQPYDKVESGV